MACRRGRRCGDLERSTLIARAFFEQELPAAILVAAKKHGVVIEHDIDELVIRFFVDGPGANGTLERYLVSAAFDGYRQVPPDWQFLHPVTEQAVGVSAYPAPAPGVTSIFHGNGLVCAPWSRRAYGGEFQGPHAGDWGAPSNWQVPRPQVTQADTMADMVDRLITEIRRRTRGRMAPLT